MITLFSWGYWGWGNATKQLVEAFDAVEEARGFSPPIFVDARLRRQGRAKGFVANAFRDQVGESRYHWTQDLGNLAIATGGGGVRIKNPQAVSKLLDLAIQAANERQRVIFYCACEFPRRDGRLSCHRLTITNLLLAHAKNVGQEIAVVEWPGGDPIERRLEVDRTELKAVMRGTRKSIRFTKDHLEEFAGLPWASALALECEDRAKNDHVLVGPARFATAKARGGFWYLPIIQSPEPCASNDSLLLAAERWRTAHGLTERRSH